MTSELRLPLAPLPYHLEMVRYLQTREADLWRWFSADRLRTEQNEAVRLDLLKSTYRIERDSASPLYAAADEVARKLELHVPVTFYQSQSPAGLNASLAYTPGEMHLVLMGPVGDKLSPQELRCVCGHEMLHFALLERWREYLIASQILAAMTQDTSAEMSHIASARMFGLYTEVYCDRGSYQAAGDLAAAISALVKIETGAVEVSADSYLRQMDEIFSRGHPRAEGVTHPEVFIRAKALKLWADTPALAFEEIRKVIEGPLSIGNLELLGQESLSKLTRRLISHFLRPQWMHTEPVLAHARLFFDDFKPSSGEDRELVNDLKSGDSSVTDYISYVLLDFAAADRELEDAPLAAAMVLTDEFGFGERFRSLAAKELNLRKKQIDTLYADADKIVAKAQESGADS